jgi:hypothetical protein
MTETDDQNLIRLAAAQRGEWLMRNNSGAGKLASGNFVRFGLGNDSERINDVMKSSDLIGIKTVIITMDMVGQSFGRFMAREVKKRGWKYAGTPRELAQLRFIDEVRKRGGDACFVTSEDLC